MTNKTPALLLFSCCFMVILSLSAVEADTPDQAAQTLQKKVLKFLKPTIYRSGMYSRAMLTPPIVEWRESVSPKVKSFVVTHGANQKLLGLYDQSKDEVWLLDPSTRTYVEPSKHPALNPPRS